VLEGGLVMRRKDREVTDVADIEAILNEAMIVRVGLCSDGIPYVVPMNFGYSEGCLYMHSAKVGTKLDIIKKNNNVCFETDIGFETVQAERACEWGARYKSVIGFGKASLVESYDEKIKALNAIMLKYSGRGSFHYDDKEVNAVTVIKIEVESMTGKKCGY